ncbi:MAG TPA: hypothetical protein VF487_09905 [Chitinophagaceae bacterium]
MNNINLFIDRLWGAQNQTTIFYFIYYSINCRLLSIENLIDRLALDSSWKTKASDTRLEFEKNFPDYSVDRSYSVIISINKDQADRWNMISLSTNDSFSDISRLVKEFSLKYEMSSSPRGESSVFFITEQSDVNGPFIIQSLTTNYIEPNSSFDEKKIEVAVIKMGII